MRRKRRRGRGERGRERKEMSSKNGEKRMIDQAELLCTILLLTLLIGQFTRVTAHACRTVDTATSAVNRNDTQTRGERFR